ncbi:YbeD family protein [Marinomonas epiphytica]
MALITKDGDQAHQAPKIEFPCENYVIKVVAMDVEGGYDGILSALKQHAPELDDSNVAINRSSKGRFISYTFRITATGEEQLAAIHAELKKVATVKMVM